MVVGLDEVGRGAWAGPLLVAAVGLNCKIEGLADSKQIDKRTRIQLAEEIHNKADFMGFGWVSAQEIDRDGLTQALRIGCQRAIESLENYDEIIIDGSVNFLAEKANSRCLIKADQTEPAVSAASIVAKVARDGYMANQTQIKTAYGFASNVGYGTKKHIEALSKWGITPLHRLSYKPVQALSA